MSWARCLGDGAASITTTCDEQLFLPPVWVDAKAKLQDRVGCGETVTLRSEVAGWRSGAPRHVQVRPRRRDSGGHPSDNRRNGLGFGRTFLAEFGVGGRGLEHRVRHGDPPPLWRDANLQSAVVAGPTRNRPSLVGVPHPPSSLVTSDTILIHVLACSRLPCFFRRHPKDGILKDRIVWAPWRVSSRRAAPIRPMFVCLHTSVPIGKSVDT